MMSEKAIVLIVEDDANLSFNNRRVLEKEGYAVVEAATLEEARSRLSEVTPDVILLDVMLPDGNGFDFCREIRESTPAHIIFLTSVSEPDGEFEGLRAGGDDYLVKPYAIKLLRERVRNAISRRQGYLIQRGLLTIDTNLLKASIGGEDMLLSHKEFSLLLLLARHEDLPLGGEHLYETVWGLPSIDDSKAIKNAVYRLRKKLTGSGYTITAEYGKGYVFERE